MKVQFTIKKENSELEKNVRSDEVVICKAIKDLTDLLISKSTFTQAEADAKEFLSVVIKQI